MSRYQAFGLVLDSDLELPELLPGEAKPDVEVREVPNASLLGPEEISPEDKARRVRLDIRVAGIFVIEDGSRITFFRQEGVTDSQVRLFLLGSCMGCVLQQRGYVVLHGNAVSTDGKTCRIIVGNSGAGKSTAAAWHYRQGHSILADDVCAIGFDEDGKPFVVPAYPQIKLWRASADLLGIPTEGLRPVFGRDKFGLPLGDHFVREPLPLTEVIELSAENTESVPWRGREKVACLLRHSYRHTFIARMGREPEYLKKILRLASIIDVHTGVRKVIEPVS
jgi:hypothetical protein